MGWIKNAKANLLSDEAARAAAEGRTVFAPMLNTPVTHHTMSGSVAGWAEMIESIEAQGGGGSTSGAWLPTTRAGRRPTRCSAVAEGAA